MRRGRLCRMLSTEERNVLPGDNHSDILKQKKRVRRNKRVRKERDQIWQV